tara:strand:+ start:460 stop:873 length:414 start_codon:yes stop_codon:yes gene_type:complete
VICPANAIPPEETRGFVISDSHNTNQLDLIIWHTLDGLRGFVNSCPHFGLPLETLPDRFLNASGDALVCSAHGAVFDATGFCLAGPCQGKSLVPLELDVRPGASADTSPAAQTANYGALTDKDSDKDIVLIGRLAHS